MTNKEETVSISKKEYEALKSFFDSEGAHRETFAGTKFFKRRLIVFFSLFLGMLLASGFVPKQTGAEINAFSYLLMVFVLLAIAIIDQLIFGWYLYRKQQAYENDQKIIE